MRLSKLGCAEYSTGPLRAGETPPGHLMVDVDSPSSTALALAEIVVHRTAADPARWVTETLHALPGALLATARDGVGWLVGGPGGWLVRIDTDRSHHNEAPTDRVRLGGARMVVPSRPPLLRPEWRSYRLSIGSGPFNHRNTADHAGQRVALQAVAALGGALDTVTSGPTRGTV